MSIARLLTEIILLFCLVSHAAADTLRITSASNREVVSQHTLSEGVDISCTVEAYSLPHITWYYNSSIIPSPNSTDTNSVAENAVMLLHSTLTVLRTGVYYCIATGDFGSIRSHDICVELAEAPDFITLQIQTPALTLRHGWSIILPCLSTQQPYFSASWWYNGNKLQSQPTRYISHTGNLHVYEAGLQFNGSYHCTVLNQITNETFTGPTLHLLVTTVGLPIINNISPIQQPDTVYVDNNSDINLEYNRYYQPLYNITWQIPLQPESPMAPEVSDIKLSSNYTVVVFTDEQVEESVDIKVKIVSLPLVEINLPNVHYICDINSTTLSCDVTDDIPRTTKVTWYHNSEFITTGSSLSPSEAGYYQCVADNEVGTASDSTLLLYPDALELSINVNSTLLVSFGSPLSLNCRDIHGTINKFFWTYNLTELSPTSQLYIPYMTSDNAGDYTCATYVCGSIIGNETVHIEVTEPIIRLTQLFNSPYSVDISWPSHPRAVSYTLEYQRAGNISWDILLSAQALHFIIQLQKGISYTFRVSYSLQTAETLLVTSDSILLDYAPLITRITSLSSTQVLVHWEWEGDISSLESFTILYEQRSEIKNVTLIAAQFGISSNYFETTLSDLIPNSDYSLVVFGIKVSEEAWNTPYSLTEYFTTLPTELVTSPADLSITYFPSSNSISVTYSLLNVTEEFGDILGYKIFLYIDNYPFNTTAYIQAADETSRTLPLRRGFNNYHIQVLGFTLAGDGPVSGVYFSRPSNTTDSTASVLMTSSPTNSTMDSHPLIYHLPYLVAIPISILLTCIVIVLVLIGKCFHMNHLNNIKEEAEGVKVRRYYETQSMITRNASTSKVLLQSEHKSVEHPKSSLTIPGRERTRTYQVASSAEATGTQSNQQVTPISFRHIPRDTDPAPSFPQQDIDLSFMTDFHTDKQTGFVESKPRKNAAQTSHSHEFAV